ncbi:MAG: DUF3806 domain-containing protein [Bifidobacteriaceae bacterium]|jgi:hypothetical protein|nr:DUF3806 domain-containing protein [Bifidobacteriaceae bacterium]
MTTIGPVEQWAHALDQHREWVRGWISDSETAARFDSDWGTKLQVVSAVAANLDAGDTTAWQALGVVFGDALALATDLPWGEVTDEYGTDPGIVANADMNAVVFPLTMLSKRAERGDPPDRDAILSLFQQVAAKAQELAQSGSSGESPDPTQQPEQNM